MPYALLSSTKLNQLGTEYGYDHIVFRNVYRLAGRLPQTLCEHVRPLAARKQRIAGSLTIIGTDPDLDIGLVH